MTMRDIALDRVQDGIAVLTLNRPKSLNSMTMNLVEELYLAFDELSADPTCQAIILTGAGKGFSSGHDLSELAEHGPSDGGSEGLTIHDHMTAQEC